MKLRRPTPVLALLAAAAPLAPPALLAGPNPTSKFYVADCAGDCEIDTGQKTDDLTKHSVYSADGTVVETKPNSVNAMVFSNGTGVFFDQDTKLEVKKFEQEPFVPQRTDMDTEPSISQTSAYLAHGTVGLCTSKLVAGSTMTYQTSLGAVNIQGGQVVVQATPGQTVISMLDGESTVTTGDPGAAGTPLHDGEQAVITQDPNGGPAHIRIQSIPSSQLQPLSNLVTMACTSKKTVYFQAVGGPRSPLGSGASSPAITAFDGDDGGTGTPTPTGPINAVPPQTIVAVPVAAANPPAQFVVSPAELTTSGTGG